LLDSQQIDKSKIGLGYNSQGVDSPVLENQENDKTSKGYHAVPPPYTGNYMPHKPDLILTDMDENVDSKPVTSVPTVATSEVKTSGKDILKLKELMKLCIKLSDRVLYLEKTKTAQAKKIADLKKRVKKLERKRRYKTPGMDLYKIGTSSGRSLGEEDASKQGRNLKQRSIFEESDFDVQAMMDADYELAARLRVEEQRRKPLTKA
nr:hypothetical protein [Tanacetum cinerariifolium]